MSDRKPTVINPAGYQENLQDADSLVIGPLADPNIQLDSSGSASFKKDGTQTITVENNSGSGNVNLDLKTTANTFKIGLNNTANYFNDTAGNPYVWSQGGNERLRIDFMGRTLFGTSTSRSVLSSASPGLLQVEVNGTGNFPATFMANRADQYGPVIAIAKSRGATSGSQNLVINNDVLGVIGFGGTDGSNELFAAQITAEVDGTAAANKMPGRLVFSTTSANTSSPREVMRLDNSGDVLIGGTAASPNIHLKGAGEIIVGSDPTSAGTPEGVKLKSNGGVSSSRDSSTDTNFTGYLEGTAGATVYIYADGRIITLADARINGVTVGKGGGSQSENTAVGSSALKDNTLGNYNTAVGANALYSNTGGAQNTAIGRSALVSLEGGNYNVAIGESSLTANVSGLYNTCVGQTAGASLTGSNNTILGAFACNGEAGLSSTIVLAAGTTERARCNSSGNWQIGGTTSAPNIQLEPDGNITAKGVISTAIATSNSGWAIDATNNDSRDGQPTIRAKNSGGGWLFGGLSADDTDVFVVDSDGSITAAADATIRGLTIGKGKSETGGNTALGDSCLSQTTGATIANTAVGYKSGTSLTEGGRNTSVGYSSLQLNQTGGYNTCIGFNSGYSLTGSNNTIIGSISASSEPDLSNTIILAAGSTERARCNSSGKWSFGNGISGDFHLDGELGVGGTASAPIIKLKNTGDAIYNYKSNNKQGVCILASDSYSGKSTIQIYGEGSSSEEAFEVWNGGSSPVKNVYKVNHDGSIHITGGNTGSSTGSAGATFSADGFLSVRRSDSASSIFAGYAVSGTSPVIDLKADGSITAAGDLNIGGDIDFDGNLDVDGNITAAGEIISGGDPNDGTAVGCKLLDTGIIQAARSSGGSAVWNGYTQGSSTATSRIGANGTSYFASTMGIGGTAAAPFFTMNANSNLTVGTGTQYTKLYNGSMLISNSGSGQAFGVYSTTVGDHTFTVDVGGRVLLGDGSGSSDIGVKIDPNGYIHLTRANGNTDTFFRGWRKDTGVEVLTFDADGSITAAGDLSIGGDIDFDGDLDVDGNITSAGNIQSGGDPDEGTADGAQLRPAGVFYASRASGESIFSGYTTGSTDVKLSLKSDGSSYFTGDMGIGGTSADPEIELKNDGSIIAAADATIRGLTIGKGKSETGGNTALGDSCLGLTTGATIANTAVGYKSGAGLTEGGRNTSVGYSSLQLNQTGGNNTCIGFNAGYSLTGSSNTIIGCYSAATEPTLTGTIILAAGSTERARCNSSGKWSFTNGFTGDLFIDGSVGIGGTSAAPNIDLNETGASTFKGNLIVNKASSSAGDPGVLLATTGGIETYKNVVNDQLTGTLFQGYSANSAAEAKTLKMWIASTGSIECGGSVGVNPNIKLNASDGSITAAGTIESNVADGYAFKSNGGGLYANGSTGNSLYIEDGSANPVGRWNDANSKKLEIGTGGSSTFNITLDGSNGKVTASVFDLDSLPSLPS